MAPPAGEVEESARRAGVVYAVMAYGAWGVVPLFWKQLERLDAVEILAHRVFWSLVFMGVVLFASRRTDKAFEALRSRKQMSYLVLSGALIAGNWGLFIWAVLEHRLLEASLGYFMNPLVNVVLGVLLLRERLRRAQAIGVLLGLAGLFVMIVATSSPVWVALSLASSFAVYGYLRKVAPVESLVGLFVETLLVSPAAIFVLISRELAGTGIASRGDLTLLPWAVMAGPVTAVPLAMFAAAARRLPLSVLGFFQYLAPSLQFLVAVTVFGERVEPARFGAFGLIWLALVVVSIDAARAQRAAARVRSAAPGRVTAS
ncbi:MAG: EamA family transporter RarD [Myxococcales bacterium]|nr:EamA family transporter RarD [Myxococcales bacterium]